MLLTEWGVENSTYCLCRNELNGTLMNGSRVRDGEGRFITFYFIIFYTISFFIYKKKYESYKSTLTIPHLWPISYNKKITGNLKNSIVFFRFITTFSEYSIILFKTVWNESNFRDMAVLNQISQELQLGRFAEYT